MRPSCDTFSTCISWVPFVGWSPVQTYNSRGTAAVGVRHFMKRFKFELMALSIVALVLAGANADERVGGDKVAPAIALPALPFEPKDVQLLDGPFKHAMELDAKFLLSVEPDRLLSWFRKEAGLEPKAQNYGGWEARGIAGHSLGHYLSAC